MQLPVFFWIALPLNMGLRGYPKRPTNDYQSTQLDTPEERKPLSHRGTVLESGTVMYFLNLSSRKVPTAPVCFLLSIDNTYWSFFIACFIESLVHGDVAMVCA
jgi:hypothetical protein